MKIKLKGKPEPITILLALLLFLWMILVVALTDSWSICGLTIGRRWQFFGTGHITRHAVTTTTRRFNSRRFHIREGDELSLAYSADVKEGSVRLYVMRVQRFPVQVDTVWSHTIKASEEDEITIPIPQSGRYKVGVKLGHFQGDVDLRWSRIRNEKEGVHQCE